MPRYEFTPHDLQRLSGLLSAPLVKDALAASVPVRKIERPGGPERDTVELPVEIRTREDPNGVPLADVLAELQKESPSVTGVAVKGSRLIVTHGRVPSKTERKRFDALVENPQKFRQRLEPRIRGAKGEREASADDLVRVLRDDKTPDDEWLRAFRRYAVEHLVGTDPA